MIKTLYSCFKLVYMWQELEYSSKLILYVFIIINCMEVNMNIILDYSIKIYVNILIMSFLANYVQA